MKTLAIIFYGIGCALLVATCFVTGIALTWWLGGFAIAALVAGCIFQYSAQSHELNHRYKHHSHTSY